MGYGEFLKQNIFDPLDMKSTAYDFTEEQLENKAKGYVNVADINKKDAVIAPNMNMSYAYSAGGLYSTVEDMYKWDQALYTEKLVKKASLAKLFAPNVDNYGYGWDVLSRYKNSVSHDGNAKGFISIIYRFMDKKTTIIVLMNEQDMFGFKKILKGMLEIAEKYEILPDKTSN
jgi:CubicO group peptidase (beta-lactamase class C family)